MYTYSFPFVFFPAGRYEFDDFFFANLLTALTRSLRWPYSRWNLNLRRSLLIAVWILQKSALKVKCTSTELLHLPLQANDGISKMQPSNSCRYVKFVLSQSFSFHIPFEIVPEHPTITTLRINENSPEETWNTIEEDGLSSRIKGSRYLPIRNRR